MSKRGQPVRQYGDVMEIITVTSRWARTCLTRPGVSPKWSSTVNVAGNQASALMHAMYLFVSVDQEYGGKGILDDVRPPACFSSVAINLFSLRKLSSMSISRLENQSSIVRLRRITPNCPTSAHSYATRSLR